MLVFRSDSYLTSLLTTDQGHNPVQRNSSTLLIKNLLALTFISLSILINLDNHAFAQADTPVAEETNLQDRYQ